MDRNEPMAITINSYEKARANTANVLYVSIGCHKNTPKRKLQHAKKNTRNKNVESSILQRGIENSEKFYRWHK